MPAGVVIQKIDYDDPSSLTSALRGQDALIITMAPFAPPEQQSLLISAAAEAGVKWILPNEWGNDNGNDAVTQDLPMYAQKTQYRQQIETLGTSSWIGIICGFWYEVSLSGGPDRYGFDIPNRTLTLFDEGTVKHSTCTLLQNARGVANLLRLPIVREDENDTSPCLNDWKNKFAYFASFSVSQREMWESVMRVTGTGVGDWKVEREDAKERYRKGMDAMGKGDWGGMARAMYSRVFWEDGIGWHEATKGLDNGKVGLEKEDLDGATRRAVEMAVGAKGDGDA